jgi:preprotein translocase SecE subunit
MNIEKIKNYLKESFLELKKVKWLTRQETANLTLQVVLFSLIFILIYGIFDAILVRILLMLK